ncbi:MAG: ATP-binding cassette domain-containing protein [Deltaproteobacteria bacterium]|nr:ATP-binding cassette domain-containing protein [Deltaproteobacteria bacterium]
MIEVKDLVKKFGDIEALRGVTFSVQKGEVVGFLGPNGAGKTTALKIITCFLPPTSGTVTVGGMDVRERSLEVRRRFGYVPENAPLYHDMLVVDYLRFMAELRGVPRDRLRAAVEKVVRQTGLDAVAGQSVGTLSKGYRQRTCLAQALVHDPEILVLDEPTVGLDPNQIVEIRSLIRELGRERTVILSSHILPEVVATCDRLLVIHRGRIVADGTPSSLEAGSAQEALFSLRLRGGELLAVQVREALAGLPWIATATPRPTGSPEEVELLVRAAGGEDVRERLVQLATGKGWPLLEVARERVSLERVFHKLTQE